MIGGPQAGPSREDAGRTTDGRPMRVNRSFVRRGGRLEDRHQQAWDRHAGRYVVEVPRGADTTSVDPGWRFDPQTHFGRAAPVVVEVGSGAGDAIAHAARQQPEHDFVALEVWRPGVAQTIAKLAHEGLSNVRVLEVDAARALQSVFAPGSVEEVWTFFSDPWPKTKHHKRRLVTAQLGDDVARMLCPGGSWRLATDWADYAWWIRDVVEEHPLLENPHAGERPAPDDPAGPDRGGFAPRFEGRVMTRFERKGLEAGRVVRDIRGVRRA